MKIAVDARAMTVPTFGIGRYTRSMLAHLIQKPDTQWFLYADRPLIDPPAQDNVHLRSFPASNRLMSLVRSQWWFARWAKQDAVDIYWSPRHHLPLTLSGNISQVVTIHDLVWQLFPETMLLANRWLERALMPPSLKQANHIIAVSDSTRRDLIAYQPGLDKKISVVYEAVEPVFNVVTPEFDFPYYLFVGTLEPRKNLVRLLAAFALYRERGGNCKLVVAGAKGWHLSSEQVVLHQSVTVLGHIDDGQLTGLYRAATALLLPSLYEGFGLPILEAMQQGTPVITSNRAAMPEVAGEGALYVDPLSVESICHALIEMQDVSVRSVLAQKAQKQAESFSWSKAADQTLAVFQNLLAGR